MAKNEQRCFELTLNVFLWGGEPLPESFRDWIDRAGLCHDGASATRLERVVEVRYPLSEDVVTKRQETTSKWSPWT